ncbi:MAG: diacylglycerol kinase [Treponema sp.]|jgi:diacylglycerol kinase family enzyme|nr:diacylglycerol kinase [Treponema sp.]
MVVDEFGSFVSEICAHTLLAGDRPLFWTIIANPKAGGFTIHSRWKKHYAMLSECVKRARKNPLHEKSGPSSAVPECSPAGLVLTRAAGHAVEITGSLVDDAAKASSEAVRPFNLIITAGGDGTSLEVLTRLYHAPEEIRRDFAVLRLPMGTGNDGSDTWYLDKALDLLIEPSEVRRQRALRLVTASGKGPFLAFNILSVGADAFVTHMTNKMKGKLPGDSYKIWVDVASLFYDRIYKVGFVDVRSMDEQGKAVKSFREKLLLLAVGESGRRTYGSHNWILPDDRNVCVLKQMPVFRKLRLKTLLKNGTHVDTPEAMLWNASAVEFSSQYPLLAQMDGETVLLKEGDFPARIELSPPVIPVLRKVAGDQGPGNEI